MRLKRETISPSLSAFYYSKFIIYHDAKLFSELQLEFRKQPVDHDSS